MARTRKKTGRALVLADVPERVHLRAVQAELEAKRDQIAEIDLEIETLREELAQFESHYHARLAVEHNGLARVQGLTRHLERWADLLRALDRPEVVPRAQRIETRRASEIDRQNEVRWARRGAEKDGPSADPARARAATKPALDADELARRDRLKEAYRALARRFHPDLCRTEDERLKHSEMMVRINALYRSGDLERLSALAEQQKGAELDDPELTIEEQTELLAQRLRWFDAVLNNLREERASLETSSTCTLLRNYQEADGTGRDLIDELRGELQERIEQAYKEIREAVTLLEKEVSEFNRKGASQRPLTTRRQGEALQRVFDPFADKRLVRLGLEQLQQIEVTSAARELSTWVESSVATHPELVRLLLLTYCSELSPFPLEGLENFEAISARFDYLNRSGARDDAAPTGLERALVEADDLVEYGVKRATDKVVHMGLRFRTQQIRDAVTVSLPAFAVRRLLREVLSVLSADATCSACKKEIYPVPLYRLRGIDNMRASVCPRCGHTLASYWMPKGQDIQSVLNQAFLDFELISEWSFTLARASVAMQLVPVQVDRLTVADLKQRLTDDIFARYELTIPAAQIQLRQNDAGVPNDTALGELEQQSFVVRFIGETEVDEAEALELVRHRIRNRFAPGS